tara:strand:- start:49 stop:501 length:453 start_codon:yes stop_codon:yes gene_type:complete
MAKQNLTPTAKRMKAARDKKAAMTPNRRKKKAENQRKRRAAIKAGKNINGKDYDHKDKKFKSVKANRGNDGKGTKKENNMKKKKAPIKQKKSANKGILGLVSGATSKFFKMPKTGSQPQSPINEFSNLLPTVNVRPKKKNLVQKLFSFKK